MTDLDNGAAAAATEGGAASGASEATPTMDQTMAAVFDKMEGGARDNAGRFSGKGGDATTDTTAGAATGDAGKDLPDTSTTQTQGAAQPPTPPQSWSDADKALFAKAPPEVQKAILDTDAKRTEGVNRELEKLSGERKRYETFNQVLAPIEAEARKFNMTADVAVKQMFERHQDLQTRGAEALKDLAKLYGIKFDGMAGTSFEDSGDPEIAALKSDNAKLIARLDRFENSQTQAQRTAAESQMDSVRDEKGTDGKPLRPHFEALYEDMAPIVTHLRTKNPSWPLEKLMSEAYDRAANANPDTRAKLAAEQKAKDKAEEERKAKEAAKGARRAVDNNTRQTGAHAGGGSAKAKSMDETMARVFDEQHAA